MSASWAGWHFSDAGWCCPPESRFHWYEADYYLVKEEHLEVVRSAKNYVTVGILKEERDKPRPVLVGPFDPEQEGLVWVTDVGNEEWVAMKKDEDEDDVWARPVVIRKRKRRKNWVNP